MSDTDPQVQQRDDRFEITVDGKVAGFAQFLDRDGQRILFHTEVDEAYSGQGLAGTLVGQALDTTAAAGLRIVPVCTYVDKYVAKHRDGATWSESVDPVTAESREGLPD